MTIFAGRLPASVTPAHALSGITTNSRIERAALLFSKNESKIINKGSKSPSANTNCQSIAVNSEDLLTLAQRNITGSDAAFFAPTDETGSSIKDSKALTTGLHIFLAHSCSAVTEATDVIENHISIPSSLSDDHSRSPGLCTFKITGLKALFFNQLAGIQS